MLCDILCTAYQLGVDSSTNFNNHLRLINYIRKNNLGYKVIHSFNKENNIFELNLLVALPTNKLISFGNYIKDGYGQYSIHLLTKDKINISRLNTVFTREKKFKTVFFGYFSEVSKETAKSKPQYWFDPAAFKYLVFTPTHDN